MTTESPQPAQDLALRYGWDQRPRDPVRPDWFRSWPGDARMAVMILVLHEWESIPRRRDRPMPPGCDDKTDFLALGWREYGARHGIWRILDVLDKHDVKASVLTSGLVAELFPASVRAASERGHEVGSHQWDQSVFPPMFSSRQAERDSLLLSKQALEEVIGHPIVGYMSPGPRPTSFTMELCAELGFSWTADFTDSDIPYFVTAGGKQIVSVGYSLPGFTDAGVLPHGLSGGLRQLTDEFDATYAESERQPMKFCYTIHVHRAATPGMAAVLDKFLGHVRQREGVWFPRGVDLTNFWLDGSAGAGRLGHG